jgi:hypothetical protein
LEWVSLGIYLNIRIYPWISVPRRKYKLEAGLQQRELGSSPALGKAGMARANGEEAVEAGSTWSDDKALTTFEMKSSLPPRYSPRRVRLELVGEDEIYYVVRDPLRLTHWIPRLRWKIVKEERQRPRRSQAEGKV